MRQHRPARIEAPTPDSPIGAQLTPAPAASWGRRLGLASMTAALAAGLLALDGQLGPASFVSRRVAAATILAVFTVAAGRRPGGMRWMSLAAVGSAVLLLKAPSVPLALLLYLVGISMAAAPPAGTCASPAVVLAAATYVCLRFVPDLIPQARELGEALSEAARRYVKATGGQEHRLSPTALGAPPVGLAAIYLFWSWRRWGSWARPAALIGIPAAWFLLLAPATPPSSAGSLATFSRGTYHGLAWLGCAALVDAFAPRRRGVVPVAGRGMPRLLPTLAFAGALLAGATLVGVVTPGAPAVRRVLVHNRGGLDWERPTFGRFGAFSGGMFGLLPVYARANGYRVEVLDRDAIRPSDLSGYQVLVLINSPKTWEGDELGTVRDFVARGGSLLVLGDHTDVFGLMRGFNTLLEGFGIQFLFDSAYSSARPTWRGCLAAAPDAVATGWDEENPGVAVGASLRLRGWARPLLAARYGHSDAGHHENTIGSYLGNYSYDGGERLGDLPLIATATHGRGRVVVLGDTSPFQGSISYSFPRAVGPLLAWLSRPNNALDRPAARVVMALVLLAALVLSSLDRSGPLAASALALGLLSGVASAWAASEARLRSPVAVGPDCVLIDQSHFPATGHYDARINPSGPLSTNLLRCGLRVADLDEWDPAAVSRARGVAMIAPRRPITDAELQTLLRTEEAGGVVVLAVGQPDSAASAPLLRAHGLDLVNRPLGTVPPGIARPGRRERETPRFLDAWPIVNASGADPASDPRCEVLFRAGRDAVAVFRRHGRGGLLLFSDTRFFSVMNVEDVSGYWIGNLAFIHNVFTKYFRVDAQNVRPVFASPRKPD